MLFTGKLSNRTSTVLVYPVIFIMWFFWCPVLESFQLKTSQKSWSKRKIGNGPTRAFIQMFDSTNILPNSTCFGCINSFLSFLTLFLAVSRSSLLFSKTCRTVLWISSLLPSSDLSLPHYVLHFPLQETEISRWWKVSWLVWLIVTSPEAESSPYEWTEYTPSPDHQVWIWDKILLGYIAHLCCVVPTLTSADP